MLKKENFVNIINAFIAQEEKESDISKKFETIIDGYFILDITSDFREVILAILENEMEDPYKNDVNGSLISWWFYGAPNHGRDKDSAWIELADGRRIALETPEQLYDYLKGGRNLENQKD